MTRMAILAVLLVVGFLVTLAGVGVLVLWLRFHRGPACQWRLHVQEFVKRWHETRQRLDAQVHEMSQRRAREIDALRDRWLEDLLGRASVRELDRYPGIGPATIDRLADFAFHTLRDLKKRNIDIPGIGEKRLRDIKTAFEQHVQAIKTRFQSSDEARELQNQVLQKSQELDREVGQLQAQRRVVEELAPRVHDLESRAGQVTFWNFLAGKLERVVPSALIEALLPDIEARLALARSSAAATPQGAPTEQKTGAAGAPSGAPSSLAEEDRADRRLEAEVQFLYAVARCDGHTAKAEKDFIERHLAERFAHERALLNRARGLSSFYEAGSLDVEDCLEKIDAVFGADDRARLFRLAITLTQAAAGRNQKEARFLERLCNRWELELPALPEPIVEKVVEVLQPTQTAPSLNGNPTPANRTDGECRQILEIALEVALTPELVRRSYHRLHEKFDPEKVADLGSEFVQMAQAKREQIEEAAKALMTPFNEELTPPAREPVQDLRHNPDLDDLFGA